MSLEAAICSVLQEMLGCRCVEGACYCEVIQGIIEAYERWSRAKKKI